MDTKTLENFNTNSSSHQDPTTKQQVPAETELPPLLLHLTHKVFFKVQYNWQGPKLAYWLWSKS